MTYTYDDVVDALYVYADDGQTRGSVTTVEIAENIFVDLDDQGRILGVEILDARARLGPLFKG